MENFKVTYWDKEQKLCYKRINDQWVTIIHNLKHHGIDENNLISIEIIAKQTGV